MRSRSTRDIPEAHAGRFALSILLLGAPTAGKAADDSVEIGALYSLSAQESGRARSGEAADVAVSAEALRTLARRPTRAVLRDLPLADGTTETFVVEPFEVFTDDAIVYEFDGHAHKPIPLPNVALFAGSATSDPSTSIVLSVTAGSSMRAVMQKDLVVVSAVGPAANGTRHTIAGAQVIERAWTGPGCSGEAVSPRGSARTGTRSTGGRLGATDEILETELSMRATRSMQGRWAAAPHSRASTWRSSSVR